MAKNNGVQIAIALSIVICVAAVGFVTVNNFMISNTDTDGDGVADIYDMFPNDPNEWVDTDGDGVGDNYDPDPNDPDVFDLNITMVVTVVVTIRQDGVSVTFDGLVASYSQEVEDYMAGHTMDSWEINFARAGAIPGTFQSYDIATSEWVDTGTGGYWHIHEYTGPGAETKQFDIRVTGMLGQKLLVDVKGLDSSDMLFLRYGYDLIIGKSGE